MRLSALERLKVNIRFAFVGIDDNTPKKDLYIVLR
jgi:hypothetical protein